MVLLAIWVALKLRESKARVIPSQSPSLLLLACSDRRELQLRSAMEFPVWQACLSCVCVRSAAHAQHSGASRAWTFLPESTCPFVKQSWADVSRNFSLGQLFPGMGLSAPVDLPIWKLSQARVSRNFSFGQLLPGRMAHARGRVAT
jgi:hypothetical protein